MVHDHSPQSLVELFENSVRRYAENPLFGTKNSAGIYEWTSYAEVGRRVDNLRGGLAQLGVGRGDAVGVIAVNRVEWAVCAFATFGLGARFVPLYESELKKTWRYCIDHGDVKVLFVANPAVAEEVAAMHSELPGLQQVVVIDAAGDGSMAALERRGEKKPVDSLRPAQAEIAALIYTSGTTGSPKGVLLSHGNFTTNSRAGRRLFRELDCNSRALSILPWAHSYAQTAELYTFIHLGAAIGIAGAVDTLAEDLKKVKPTFLFAVPRVFNKIHDGIWRAMDQRGGVAKKLFVMAVELARRKRALAAVGSSALAINLGVGLANALLFKKIHHQFGGRLTGALTASATMNVKIANFFSDIGLPVYDCYGLTETSPAVTMSSPGAKKPGSVGRPIERVRVEIDTAVVEEGATDGEIVVYGPNVMQGYHKDTGATQAVMTPDGGFRTGDRGYLDEDGFLFITGRIKEQYKLENGKYVFPATLEEEIRRLPMIENAMVYGEDRPFNVCLLVPEATFLQTWAKENGLAGDRGSLSGCEALRAWLGERVIDHLSDTVAAYEIPRAFILLPEDFTVSAGTLTQTMKLRRQRVVNRFKEAIEAAYQPTQRASA